jgi:hypothetical protein
MTRSIIAFLLLSLGLGLSACQSGEEESAPKADKVPVVLTAPVDNNDNAWKTYLGQVVAQNMAGVTDRVFAYYLPIDSTAPTPGDPDNRSQYDRQLENVSGVLARSVLPGNMLAFGSPDSAKIADLIVAAFTGAKADALKGSQVLLIGKVEDQDRVKAAADAVGAHFIFVEIK